MLLRLSYDRIESHQIETFFRGKLRGQMALLLISAAITYNELYLILSHQFSVYDQLTLTLKGHQFEHTVGVNVK